MKNNRLWLAIGIIVVILIIGYGVFFTRDSSADGVIKIGVLTPLSGPAAVYGENILDGIECAQEVINDETSRISIELVIEDSKCDGKEAISATNNLLRNSDVNVIVGQACSAAAVPVASISEDRDFILIASAASNPAVTESKNVFRVNPSDLAQSEAIAEHIVNELGKKRVSILALNDEYGNGLVDEFERKFNRLGGEILSVEWFGINDGDFKTQIIKLEEPEILFIIALPGQHPQIAKQLVELGKNWDRVAEFNFAVVPEDAGNSAMKGTIYPISVFDDDASDNAKLLANCMEEKGKSPDVITAWGFDALYVAAKASENCSGRDDECIRNNLESLRFDGASGKGNSFRDNGDVKILSFEFVEF